MSDWSPDLGARPGPRYLAITEALADDIDAGALGPGARLPTHRDLARRLGISVGSVSRAYAEAGRRRLIVGEVGRGTFVRGRAPEGAAIALVADGESGLVDLTLNRPAAGEEGRALASVLGELSRRKDLAALASYQPEAGMPAHRAAGAAWIGRRVRGAEARRVIVTNGGQHAIAVALMALVEPDDVVLTESLTWPGIKALASMLRLKLIGVAIDRDGLVPEAFEAACLSWGARVLYCMPTLHNPTTAIMPAARRAEIVEIARRHDVSIIEDDVYAFLPAAAPPTLAEMAPERTYYLTSASKSMAPGLRTGFLMTPDEMVERVAAGVRATTFMSTPLMAEIAATWIADGTADALAEWQRREASARQAIASVVLGEAGFASGHSCFHVWLALPEPWRAAEFVEEAAARGVAVTPADTFAAGRSPAPHAVRVALGAARDRRRLEKGLEALAGILGAPARPRLTLV